MSDQGLDLAPIALQSARSFLDGGINLLIVVAVVIIVLVVILGRR